MWIDNLCSRFPDKLQKLDWVAPDPHLWPSSHLRLSSTFWLFTSLQRQTQQKYNSETLKIKRGFWNWANDQDSTWSSPSPVTLQAGSTATRVQRPHSPSPRAWILGKMFSGFEKKCCLVLRGNVAWFWGKKWCARKSNPLADIRSTKCRGKVLLVCQNQQGDVLVVLVPETKLFMTQLP